MLCHPQQILEQAGGRSWSSLLRFVVAYACPRLEPIATTPRAADGVVVARPDSIMTSATIDTHAMVKRLAAAGFTAEQAETVTDVLRESRELDLGQLAMKADLVQLRSDLRAELAALETRLTLRLGGMLAAGIAITAALIKLL